MTQWPRVVPNLPAAPVNGVAASARRAVFVAIQGETWPAIGVHDVEGHLLCDEAGRLYERFGPWVRPVHRLATTPHGQIVDVRPAPPPSTAWPSAAPHPTAGIAAARTDAARSAQAHAHAASQQSPRVNGLTAETPTARRDAEAPADASNRASRGLDPGTLRPLFEEPGLHRVVRFGDFKAVLATQVAAPARLRDAHRLRCVVQVFAGAAVAAGDRRDLHSLTRRARVLLELPASLDAAAEARDHLFRLALVEDPTRDTHASAPAPTSVPAGAPAAGRDVPDPRRAGDAAAPAAAAAPAVPRAFTPLKRSIPASFLKPWEFQFGREEASTDLLLERLSERTAWGWMRGLLRRCRRGRDLRAWSARLAGKPIDQQLWSAAPPRGTLTAPHVIAWARRMLARGGYDVAAMLPEWQVFWRRKGC